jgi:hypothetical protein
MEMRDMSVQLKSVEVDISESFLVHFVLNSLPSKHTLFKISYNTHKDKWSVNELLTMCVQEDVRLKHEKPQIFTLLLMIKERPREARMPHTSRKKTSCQSIKMAKKILVSSATKRGI